MDAETALKKQFFTAEELPNDAYHGGPGISNSGLKLIGSKTPFHFYGQYLDPNKPARKGSRAMLIGTALHAAVLEPHKFEEEFVVADFRDRGAAGYKAWAKKQDRHIIMAHEMVNVTNMRRALYNDPAVAAILRDALQFEYSVYAEDFETEELVRIRCDLVTNGGWIVDLKKCQDASDEGIRKSMFNFGYYHQDAFYTDVWTMAHQGEAPAGFAFVFVEEQYPHAVSLVVLDDEDRERGRREYRRNLDLYAHCKAHNSWPGYGVGARDISLAFWQRRRIDEKLEDFQ